MHWLSTDRYKPFSIPVERRRLRDPGRPHRGPGDFRDDLLAVHLALDPAAVVRFRTRRLRAASSPLPDRNRASSVRELGGDPAPSRNRAQELPGIGVPGVGEQLGGVPVLHELTPVRHRDPVADLRGNFRGARSIGASLAKDSGPGGARVVWIHPHREQVRITCRRVGGALSRSRCCPGADGSRGRLPWPGRLPLFTADDSDELAHPPGIHRALLADEPAGRDHRRMWRATSADDMTWST